LHYVLYGGKDSEISERLYDAAKEPKYRIRSKNTPYNPHSYAVSYVVKLL